MLPRWLPCCLPVRSAPGEELCKQLWFLCPFYAPDDGPPHGAKRTGSVLTAILSVGIRGPVCRASVGPGSQCSWRFTTPFALRAGSAQRIRSQTGGSERGAVRRQVPDPGLQLSRCGSAWHDRLHRRPFGALAEGALPR